MPIHIPVQKVADHDTSDGYHTFDELYEFRMLYNAALFNEWGKNKTVPVLKSKRHYDGELCFGGGWFIVMAELPTGQISNHYEMKDWDKFQISEHGRPLWAFDGHTPQDVADRLAAYLRPTVEWSTIEIKGQKIYRKNKLMVKADTVPVHIKEKLAEVNHYYEKA